MDIKMILAAVFLKAKSFGSIVMAETISDMLLENEEAVTVEDWEASGKRARLFASIRHGDLVESIDWQVKPVKK